MRTSTTSWKLRRAAFRFRRAVTTRLLPRHAVYIDDLIQLYYGYWHDAAAMLGADIVPLRDAIWEVRLGSRRTRIAGHSVALDDPVTLRLAGDKSLCYEFATQVGLPVPDHRVLTLATAHEAVRFLESSDTPVVLKPMAGSSSGMGVSTNVGSVRALKKAFLLASLFCDSIIVERMIPAESCRLLFLDGNLLHAVRRRGTRLIGDGVSTIAALMERSGIAVDDIARSTLAAQQLDMRAVPADGAEIVCRCLPPGFRNRRELTTEYDEDITHLVCEDHLEAGRRLTELLGTRFAGIDFLTNDPSRPLRETGGVFLEINTTPGIHHHYITEQDSRRNPVAVAVLKKLLSPEPNR